MLVLSLEGQTFLAVSLERGEACDCALSLIEGPTLLKTLPAGRRRRVMMYKVITKDQEEVTVKAWTLGVLNCEKPDICDSVCSMIDI